MKTITIAAPMFNEETIIADFINEIDAVVDPWRDRYDFSLLLVNDGSRDRSEEILRNLSSRLNIRVVNFVRNFGHPAACAACLELATGDAVVLMDSDLQDDPAAIPLFLEKWEQGYDIVYAIRKDRKESIFKRSLFLLFYRLLRAIASIDVPLDSGNFSLMDRKAVVQINEVEERNRFLPGIRAYIGFKQTGVPISRRARHDNVSRVGFNGLCRLALNAFFSFSYLPIRIFNVFGFLAIVLAFGLTAYALHQKLIAGITLPAWTSQIITTVFFGGVNLLGIGIVGEYVARIYDQLKGYPKFIVRDSFNIHSSSKDAIDQGDAEEP